MTKFQYQRIALKSMGSNILTCVIILERINRDSRFIRVIWTSKLFKSSLYLSGNNGNRILGSEAIGEYHNEQGFMSPYDGIWC